MKEYRIVFTYKEQGECVVQARSKEEAEFILEDRLEQNGTDGLSFDVDETECLIFETAEAPRDIPDIRYGDYIPTREFFGVMEWDMRVFLMDMDTDPSTPYHEELLSVSASSESEARRKATDSGYCLKEACGVNVSVEVEME